jgi:hypothetical protein
VRRALLLLAPLLLLVGPGLAARARADELDAAELEAVVRALYVGRVEDAWRAVRPPEAAEGLGPFLLELSRWRRWSEAPQVAERRVPSGLPPELVTSFDVVSTLTSERSRRETRGIEGLPGDSPLARLPDPAGLHAPFLELQRSIYEARPDADPAASERAADLRARAYRIAALAMGGCLALVAAVGCWLGRRPRAGDPLRATGTGRS